LNDTLLPATNVASHDLASPVGQGGMASSSPEQSPERSLGQSVGLSAGLPGVIASAVRFPVLPPPAALLEIVVLFVLIIGLAWVTGQDLTDLRPHPFWVPVLLLSLQYGTVSGLLAAGIATAFTGLGQLPEQVVGETYFVYFLRIWIEPILWLSSAVLLGQFRMRQIANKMELVRQVQELAAQRTSLAAYSGKLRLRCEALERRLAGRHEPDALLMLQAIGRAAAPGGVGASELNLAFSRVMAAVFPGSHASMFVCDQSQLRRALTAAPVSTGITDSQPGQPTRGVATSAQIGAAHPLFQCIVVAAQGASVLTAAGEVTLAGQGLAAVPILADGAVVGMIKVEAMDSHLLGPSTLDALDTVARAFASPLQVALKSQSIQFREIGPDFSAGDRRSFDAGANVDSRQNLQSGPPVQPAPLSSVGVAVAQPGGRIWRHVARRMPAGLMGRR
jgi:hypothetical protein